MLQLSNWVCWPDLGGYLDQETAWIEDIMRYLALRRRLEWEIKVGYVDYEPLPEGMRPMKLKDLM